MGSRILFAASLISLLFLFGCSAPLQPAALSNSTNESFDGVRQQFTCSDGKVTFDLSDCITCPFDCSDKNPCTRDSCDSVSKQCLHTPVDGPAGDCSGSSGNCTVYSCNQGTCSKVPADSCCGDNKRSAGETCSSCPSDVKCVQGELCCASGCKPPECKTDADCNDRVSSTNDKCEKAGTCESRCANTQIRACISNDSICPFGCSRSIDSDCAVNTTGTTTAITGDLIVSFSNPQLQVCKIAGRDFSDNFITYTVTFENLRSDPYPVFLSGFYAYSHTLGVSEENLNENKTLKTYQDIDPDVKIQINPNRGAVYYGQLPLLSPSIDYEPPCQRSEVLTNALRDANVRKGDLAQGKVWIKIGQNGGYQNGTWSIGYIPALTPNSQIEAQIELQ